MTETTTCPLKANGAFLSESDIPDECRECLRITLDSELVWPHREIIGVPHEEDLSERINDRSSCCDHEGYYLQTRIKRGIAAKRVIEIAAECDECGNFVSNTYTASCSLD